jgi:hypothetical protein
LPEVLRIKRTQAFVKHHDFGILQQRPRQKNSSLELLKPTSGYEFGLLSLYPVYVRGKAYLKVRDGQQAAAEFQKIIAHRSIVTNDILGALAHLQLGRAYAMAGDTAKAKAAYQDFLTLWKDADPDIPILKQAKAEYAKLSGTT